MWIQKNDTEDNKVTVNGKDTYLPVALVKRMQNPRDAQKILNKKFADKNRAAEYAKERISDFDPKDDKDFDLVDEDDPAVIAQVMDCLVVLAKNAKQHKAAIIIPDYMTSSGNSKLIETALDFAEFDGPVISLCTEEQAAWDEATALDSYQIGTSTFPRGILHSRATHSIQVPQASYSRVAARLARVISDPDPELVAVTDMREGGARGRDEPAGASHNRRILVIAGGGLAVLQHVAEAVREEIPVVVLQGSRRLSDYLPKLWVKRFSAKFDVYAATLKLCSQCGFPAASEANNIHLWVRQIVEQGHVGIHPLPTGIHSLQRILQSLQVPLPPAPLQPIHVLHILYFTYYVIYLIERFVML